MTLTSCPHCGVRVIPSADGTCPSCRRPSTRSVESAATESNPYESPASEQAGDNEVDQRKLIRRGGWMFLGIVGINVSPMLWAVFSNQPVGNPGLGTILNVVLLYFLWRGQAWAKWITVALFGILAVLLISIGLFQGNVPLLIGGGVLAAVPAMLLFSKSVNAFLLEQRYRL